MSTPIPEEFLAEPRRYFLEWIPRALQERDDLASKIGDTQAVAQIELSGDGGGAWHFQIADGTVAVGDGEHAEPDFTLNMAVDTWRKMRRGEIHAQAAFMSGQMKISGNMGLAMRLAPLFR